MFKIQLNSISNFEFDLKFNIMLKIILQIHAVNLKLLALNIIVWQLSRAELKQTLPAKRPREAGN